jgi:hypothetical protein
MKQRVVFLFMALFTIITLSSLLQSINNNLIPPSTQQLILDELAQQSDEGFPAGTLIKTPSGYKPIESIGIGSPVISYDHTTNQQATSTVVDIRTVKLNQLFSITFQDGSRLQAAPHSLFYNHLQQQWTLLACDEASKKFFSSNDHLNPRDIRLTPLSSPQTCYLLLVDKHHNFFVTNQDILVHNFLFSVPLISWVFGQGLEICGIGLGSLSWPAVAAVTTIIVAQIGWTIVLEWMNEKQDPHERYDIGAALNKYMNPAQLARFSQQLQRFEGKRFVNGHIICDCCSKCSQCGTYPDIPMEDTVKAIKRGIIDKFMTSLTLAKTIQQEVTAEDPDFIPLEILYSEEEAISNAASLDHEDVYPDLIFHQTMYDQEKEICEFLMNNNAIEPCTIIPIEDDHRGIICGYPASDHDNDNNLLIQPILDEQPTSLTITPITSIDNHPTGCPIIDDPGAMIYDETVDTDSYKYSTFPASAPVGRKGHEKNIHFLTKNAPTTIAGIKYCGHAIDHMQWRGIPPSTVKEAIESGIISENKAPTRINYYDAKNNITVVTEAAGEVVTVFYGEQSIPKINKKA